MNGESHDLSFRNVKLSEFPKKSKLVVDGHIRLHSTNGLPIILRLFILCYFCYGEKDQCEQCKNGAGEMCSFGKCIRFVCTKCACSHGKK